MRQRFDFADKRAVGGKRPEPRRQTQGKTRALESFGGMLSRMPAHTIVPGQRHEENNTSR